MVDRDLLLRKLSNLETYLEQLATYRGVSLAEYADDWKSQRIIERTLHLAIETCMDVADHMVADRRLRVPETGAQTFEILGDAGLLSADLSATSSFTTMPGSIRRWCVAPGSPSGRAPVHHVGGERRQASGDDDRA